MSARRRRAYLTGLLVLAAVSLGLVTARCGGGGGVTLALTDVDPATGFTPGGATITLTGSGFAAGSSTVTVGGAPAANVVAVDDTTITCTLPAGSVGPADVEVASGAGSAALAGGFTYFGYPPGFPAADSRLDTDAPGAATSRGPDLCCDGSTVLVTWSDDRNGSSDIYLNRSTDDGVTWQAADTRLGTDPAGAANSGAPRICCDGPMVYVAWTDWRNGSPDIYFNRSTDGGATWLGADVRLDTDAPGAANSGGPRVCCTGPNVYVTWRDERNGAGDVYLNRSTDGGATWQAADTRLDTDAPGATHAWSPVICCEGPLVAVAWRDSRNGGDDVYLNRSTDGGATWLGSDMRVNTDPPGAANAWDPRICCDGSSLYVVWQDDRSGSEDIHLNRSADAGATWLATEVRLDTDPPGAANSWSPEICCDGPNVVVAWREMRNGGADVYANRSADGGVTWLGSDVRLDTDAPGAASSEFLQVCCDGLNAYVVWRDTRSGLADIYLQSSLDGGATWQATDTRLDTDAPGSATSDQPRICCDGARVYVAWEDYRNGSRDILFTASRP